ncbi:MAG: glycerol-3-phosphate acyltransferase [Clostridia bacterium]|nr:glycerol-3-phosphate acyltransferase [Clostridia bacterium]
MELILYLFAAVCGYLAAGFNPAIAMSKAIYGRDIRECGSGNPGFTNFKRTFGGRYAWFVLLLDLSKAAVAVGFFSYLFGYFGMDRQLGAAFTGCFAMLGHAYPAFYGFKGGKGFLVCLSTAWVIDLRVGLIATLLMIALLLLTHYMSLSTVLAMWSCPFTISLLGGSVEAIILCAAAVLFMTWRHKENFKRLLRGTESRFDLFDKKKKEELAKK